MSDKRTKIADGYQITGHSGGYTFYGVFRLLMEEDIPGSMMSIAREWQDSTWNTFASNINALLRIIPKTKTMSSFRDSDLEDVLQRARTLAGRQYADATIQNLEYAFLRVYKAGVDRKLFKNKLELFDLEEVSGGLSKTEYAKKIYRVKKSFTVEEEKVILSALLGKPEEMTGEQMGLLICFLCALRENEACGLDYKDMIDILDHKAHALIIYETSMLNSSKRKASGKTKNAGRIIPIFDFLSDFIKRRIHFMQKQVDSGRIQLSEKFKSVYDLPIVCIGHQYKKRCPTRNLSYAGRKFFKKLNIRGMNLSVIYKLINEEAFADYDVYEKDPTTYVFRRNRGTSLYIAGLSPDLIQYYMGQKIESKSLTRNALTNNKYLAEIKKHIDMLPIAGIRDNHSVEINGTDTLIIENANRQRIDICNSKSSGVRIIIKANEPNDFPYIFVQGNAPYELMIDTRQVDKIYGEPINVTGRLNEKYKRTGGA